MFSTRLSHQRLSNTNNSLKTAAGRKKMIKNGEYHIFTDGQHVYVALASGGGNTQIFSDGVPTKVTPNTPQNFKLSSYKNVSNFVRQLEDTTRPTWNQSWYYNSVNNTFKKTSKSTSFGKIARKLGLKDK
jgi:hypothetical protein